MTEPSHQNPALHCQQITKVFGEVLAVRDLSLTIKPGQFVALLGPSGCGKTTSLRMIAGLERPTSGTITLNGQVVVDTRRWVPPHRRRVGLVFQDYALFPHMNVGRNIAYGLSGLGRTRQRQRVAEVLELVGMSGYESRLPHELSGGQQQRVALARALAPSPRLMLLDEPFSNLDASLRTRVREDVRQILNQAGISTLLVTHDQDEALSLADEVGIMMDGRLQQVATPRMLYQQPANPAVAKFVGDAHFLPAIAQGDMATCVLGTVPLAKSYTGPAQVLIRPENLALQAAAPAHAHATVIRVSYFGHGQLVDCCLQDGQTHLQARLASDQRFAAGDLVSLRVTQPVMLFSSEHITE